MDRFKDHEHDFDLFVLIHLGRDYDVPELSEVGFNELEERGIKWDESCTCGH